jgi:glyoxylase I family protein
MLAAVNVSPARAPRVHHLAVLVRDLSRAEAFYGGVLGPPSQGAPRGRGRARAPSGWRSKESPFWRSSVLVRAQPPAATRSRAGTAWPSRSSRASVRRGESASEEEDTPWSASPPTPSTYAIPDGTLVALSHHPVAAAVEEPKEAGITQRLAALVTLSLVPSASASRPLPFARPLEAPSAGPSAAGARRRGVDRQLLGERGPRSADRDRAGGLGPPRGPPRALEHRPRASDFFDWEAEVRELGVLASMRGVVVLLGGNDPQASSLRRAEEDTNRRRRGVDRLAGRGALERDLLEPRACAGRGALQRRGPHGSCGSFPPTAIGRAGPSAFTVSKMLSRRHPGHHLRRRGRPARPPHHRALHVRRRAPHPHRRARGLAESSAAARGRPRSVALPALAEVCRREATAEDPATVPGG